MADDFPNVSVTYSRRYRKILYEPALMAVVFGYWDELINKIVECSLQSDMPILNILFNSYPIYITMSKGVLKVSNHEEETNKGKEGEEIYYGQRKNTFVH